MSVLIEVFRMVEISPEVRIRVIKELGKVINHQYCANITEPLVEELVKALELQIKDKE